ncbi:DNA-dependent ATPase protein rad54, partial [Kickxella alabastrina]
MSGSVVYASQISNKKLCKPFVSPSRDKPISISTRSSARPNALKRPIARPLGTTSKRLRIRSNNDDDDDDDAEKREDAILLPGVNYNGMSKSVFKPFRPPTKIRKDGDEEDADEAIADQSSADGKLAFRPLGMRRRLNIIRGPRYNPDTDDAVVLFRPEDVLSPVPPSPSSTSSGTAQAVVPVASKKRTLKEILGCGGSSGPEEGKLVAVVVDPVLGRKLRPHQVDGVKFLYNCITGSIYPNAFGCIMADEMGLGKTLQCIALLWTLLQQSPIAGKPIIEKCIVACPSSLVKNWANEIVKWLGSTKISPLACDNKGTKDKVTASLRAFMSARGRRVIHPVLIISYESLRIYKDILSASPIGLLMCDEGHRLKNSDSQTFQALNELQIQRRIILSGTPIQNDLSEYFSLLNFTNPGLLGDTQEFRKKYEIPIMHGRDSMATEAEQRRGDEVLSQLNAIASRVIIRRTNNLLSKYLPIKYEHVVFCPLTELQTDLYELFLKSKDAKAAIGEGGKCSLQTIISLGKL